MSCNLLLRKGVPYDENFANVEVKFCMYNFF